MASFGNESAIFSARCVVILESRLRWQVLGTGVLFSRQDTLLYSNFHYDGEFWEYKYHFLGSVRRYTRILIRMVDFGNESTILSARCVVILKF